MSTLFPRMPFVDDETPLSWAARQAALHTGGRVAPFLTDIGLSLPDVARGEDGSVRRLCEKAGYDPTPVLNNNIRAIGGGRYQLRRLEFAKEFTTGACTRICPVCLMEDRDGWRHPQAAIRHRLIWRFNSVRTCPVHGVSLRDLRSGKSESKTHELQAMSTLIGAEQLRTPCGVRTVSPLQTYTVGRLEGQIGPAWLDGQNIDQAVRATEMIGALAAFGPDKKASEMTSDMWDAAGRAGWPIVSLGANEVRDYLLSCLRPMHNDGVRPMRDLGMLYTWLSAGRHSKDPGPVREVLREVLIETTPLRKGQMLLGRLVAAPRFCSVASIALAEGLDSRRLRDTLKVAGLLTQHEVDQKSNRLVVDYTVAQDLIDIVKHAIPITRLQDVLGASRLLIEILLEIGQLSRTQVPYALKCKIGKAVDGRGVKPILAFLDANCPTVDEAPEGYVHPFRKTGDTEKSRARLKIILELMFLGHLKQVFRVTGEHGFAALVVDPNETQSFIESPPPGLSQDSYFFMG